MAEVAGCGGLAVTLSPARGAQCALLSLPSIVWVLLEPSETSEGSERGKAGAGKKGRD